MLHVISERIKRQFDSYGVVRKTNLINLVALIFFLVEVVVTIRMIDARSAATNIINTLSVIMIIGVGLIIVFFWKLKK